MASDGGVGHGSPDRGRADPGAIERAFGPLQHLAETYVPVAAGDDDLPKGESDPTVSDRSRHRNANLLVAASVLRDAVLVGAGVDLSQPLDPTMINNEEGTMSIGYGDDMLTYHLCDSIWRWNQLDIARPADDLDRMTARALVGIRDVMSAFARGYDIDKRTHEAMANLLLARPATVETMLDEARYRHLCPDIAELVVGSQCSAERHHLEKIRNQERRND